MSSKNELSETGEAWRKIALWVPSYNWGQERVLFCGRLGLLLIMCVSSNYKKGFWMFLL